MVKYVSPSPQTSKSVHKLQSVINIEEEIQSDFGPNGRHNWKFTDLKKRCSNGKNTAEEFKYIDTTAFLKEESDMCSRAGEVFTVVAVHSKPSHKLRRDAIRSTWGSMKFVNTKRIILAFFLGLTNDDKVRKSNEEESEKYR